VKSLEPTGGVTLAENLQRSFHQDPFKTFTVDVGGKPQTFAVANPALEPVELEGAPGQLPTVLFEKLGRTLPLPTGAVGVYTPVAFRDPLSHQLQLSTTVFTREHAFSPSSGSGGQPAQFAEGVSPLKSPTGDLLGLKVQTELGETTLHLDGLGHGRSLEVVRVTPKGFETLGQVAAASFGGLKLSDTELLVRPDTATRLVDALAVLLVRLHNVGFFWGDVSLSNTLFRRDAGAFAAYLVDAETGELHEGGLTLGQREHDLDVARTNIAGEIMDLITDLNARKHQTFVIVTHAPEVAARFQRELARHGVDVALRKAGVRPGDAVRIAAVELEWEPLEADG